MHVSVRSEERDNFEYTILTCKEWGKGADQQGDEVSQSQAEESVEMARPASMHWPGGDLRGFGPRGPQWLPQFKGEMVRCTGSKCCGPLQEGWCEEMARSTGHL